MQNFFFWFHYQHPHTQMSLFWVYLICLFFSNSTLQVTQWQNSWHCLLIEICCCYHLKTVEKSSVNIKEERERERRVTRFLRIFWMILYSQHQYFNSKVKIL